MEVQGKYVILFMVGTAVAAATFAIVFRYEQGRKSIELWGKDNAKLMRVDAERIEFMVLRPYLATEEDSRSDSIEIDGTPYAISTSKDIMKARGIIHARQALIEDASFNWEKQRGNCDPEWRYALRFTADNRVATVSIDTNCHRIRLLETGREAAMIPKTYDGWMLFFKDQEPSK